MNFCLDCQTPLTQPQSGGGRPRIRCEPCGREVWNENRRQRRQQIRNDRLIGGCLVCGAPVHLAGERKNVPRTCPKHRGALRDVPDPSLTVSTAHFRSPHACGFCGGSTLRPKYCSDQCAQWNAKRSRRLRPEGRYLPLSWWENKQIRRMRAGLCFYCHERPAEGVDHRIPKSRGGPGTIGNLVGACQLCNSHKGKQTVMEWRLSGVGLPERLKLPSRFSLNT